MSENPAGELSDAPEFWLPEAARARPGGPAPARGGMTLVSTLAVLQPGVTVQQATAEVNTLMPAREGQAYPVKLVNARVEQARRVRPVLLLFQGAVVFVLFIACVNVVNLLRARAADRRHELVMRLALGASRLQLARYAMTEGLIIAVLGGALGIWVAFGTVALVRALPPYVLPRMGEIRVDTIVLATAAALSIAAGLLVGATAAARILRRDVEQQSLAVQRVSAGHGHRASRALLIAETAAGVILLAGAGLLLNSFAKLTSVPRGFDPTDVFTFRLSLPSQRYQQIPAQYAFHDRFVETLRQLPGVAAVGASASLLGHDGTGFTLAINGQTVSRAEVAFQTITPGVFETLRVPLKGRDFTAADRVEQARTAIVNEEFVRRYLGGGNAIGQRLQFQAWPSLEIIAVAGNTRTRELDTDLHAALYLPQDVRGGGLGAATYYVRTSQATGLLQAVRELAARQDAGAVVFDATPMSSLLARSVTTPKVYGATAFGFAAVAVALAALGLFGVMSYSVGTRTREFGIRIALGASSRTVLRKVMREALETVAVGIVLGTLGALYLSRFLETLLYEVEPGDPKTLAAVAALFLIVAALAAYLPARRATRVDPLVALRAE